MSNHDEYIDDTIGHIDLVAESMHNIASRIRVRAAQHDRSKFSAIEAGIYEHVVPKLKTLEYGSDAYKETIKELGPALAHHYENNSHHPEHYPDGINDMDLLDLMEMLCDWKAAASRPGGDISKSLVINKKRFGIDDQLYKIIDNTARRMEA
jgi:hypothetical protein